MEHNFFVTSLGKSPCNEIGGTTAIVTTQILTPEQLFLSAKENINGVTMYYVTEEENISHKRKYDLKVCYNGV